MTFRVHFFGRPSDVFGPHREIDIPADGLLLSELRSMLMNSEPEAAALFERHGVRAAVDDVIAAGDVIVRPGQTVEFFSMFSGAEPMVRTQLSATSIAPDALLAEFLAGRTGDGAVVSFVGLARSESKDGTVVSVLHLDWHPTMTERSLRSIAEDGAARFGVSDVLVAHRCGEIAPGEAVVFVAAASPHRRDAFLAADYLMDRLKTEAAFWKRESGPDGERWIEPTESDRADLARWSDQCPA